MLRLYCSIRQASLLLGLVLLSHQSLLLAQTTNQVPIAAENVGDSRSFAQPQDNRMAADNSLDQLERDPSWKDLSAAERHLLRRHKNRWSGYLPLRKQQLLNSTRRFLALPRKKRQRVQRWVRKFRQFPVKKQRRLCRRFLQQQNYLPPPCRKLLRFRLEPYPRAGS